jgi:integrase
MYRVRRRAVMETLGTVGLVPKVDEARQMARDSLLKARAGVNPVEERKRARAEAAAAAVNKETLQAVVARYLDRHAKSRQAPETLAETMRQLNKDILPRWGDRDIASITENDVRRLRDEVHERAPIAANRVLSKLSTLFAWALREGYIDVNPTLRVDSITEEKSRDRWLTDDEIVKFWSACDQSGWPYGPLFQLLLLTAQRRDEVAGIEWNEVDLGNRVWLLPAEKAKNELAHEIQFGPLAISIITSLPRMGHRLIFTTDGTKPLRGWSASKAKLDRLMGGDNMQPWRLHDLRRTAATGMARLGVRAEVADKVLNHSSGSVIKGVARIYNRFEYIDERREALEMWSRHVESLVGVGAGALKRQRL